VPFLKEIGMYLSKYWVDSPQFYPIMGLIPEKLNVKPRELQAPAESSQLYPSLRRAELEQLFVSD